MVHVLYRASTVSFASVVCFVALLAGGVTPALADEIPATGIQGGGAFTAAGFTTTTTTTTTTGSDSNSNAADLLAARRAAISKGNAAQVDLAPFGAGKAISGMDSLGNPFKSVNDMFDRLYLGKSSKKKKKVIKGEDADGGNNADHVDFYDPEKGFYGKALRQWANEDPTQRSVTGTSPEDSKRDLQVSNEFLRAAFSRNGLVMGKGRAVDCGCGIGRTTEAVLARKFDTIDLIEPSPQMMAKAMQALRQFDTTRPETSADGQSVQVVATKLGATYNTSLELVDLPLVPTYDLVYIQWVAMYLTDNDLIDFLKKCRQSLRNGTLTRPRKALGTRSADTSEGVSEETVPTTGAIFFKENIINGGGFLTVRGDVSLNRSDKHYRAIFKAAGLRVIHEQLQPNWPEHLVPLGMYLLVPTSV